ncbi:protein of unknown function [Lachnospiraceae bacterium A10]|nr:protein of unknown function [Lachnospiraceae bacterium A10]
MTKIYVCTHKKFNPPPDELYVPLQVGRELQEDLGYLGDNTGDHISYANGYYSELTGLYWIWKNDTASDIVGTCHYRRYLLNDRGAIFTEPEIQELLQNYDVITTKNLDLNYSYYEGFGENHKIYYLKELEKVLRRVVPEDYPVYEKLVHEKHTYFGNMMIASKRVYDDYCNWLFSILFEMERNIEIDEPDSYHRRIFGFLSEFLFYVYVVARGLKVRECKVGMIAEKAEITEIKREIAKYFKASDLDGAKKYFLDCRSKRPDIMMEASDITGELHLCMEVMAIAGLEKKQGLPCLLDYVTDYQELMDLCNRLNHFVIGELHDSLTAEEKKAFEALKAEEYVSTIALDVARKMFENNTQAHRYVKV